jgi:hypothetical protein
MSKFILKTNNNLLISGSKILTSSSSAALPVVHLKAENITGLSDGELVMGWQNSSGVNNHYNANNTTEAPVYRVNGINGKPGVEFNKTKALWALTPPTTRTIFLVVKFLTLEDGEYRTMFGSSTPNISPYQGGNTAKLFYSSGAAPTFGHYLMVDDISSKIWLNGIRAAPNHSLNRQSVATLLTIETNYNHTDRNIDILGNQSFLFPNRGIHAIYSEFLIYNISLTEDVRKAKENELMAYYNL